MHDDEYQPEPDWWDRLSELSWQQMTLLLAAIGAFVILAFAPPAGCSLHVTSSDATTTTTAR